MRHVLFDLSHISFEGAESPQGRTAARVGGTRHPRAELALEEHAPHPFIIWLFEQSRLDSSAYRSAALDRRLPACLRMLRTPSPESARELLQQRPELLSFALGTVLIGVSDFFRDEVVFRALQELALPQLFAESERVRVLSLGCSNGQELYSVAMLAAGQRSLDRLDLLGVDRRPEAIAAARRGVYSKAEVANLSPTHLKRFFVSEGERWRLVPWLRSAANWEIDDLLALKAGDTWRRGGHWDLVLCRNLLIYLRPERGNALWRAILERLRPGAFLVTGRAEKPPADLPLLRLRPSVYRYCP